MPLLFSLAIHDPLEEALRELRPEEHFFAIWTTCVSLQTSQTEPAHRTTVLERSCSRRRGSDCTQARPECGIVHPCVQWEWLSWDPTCGIPRG